MNFQREYNVFSKAIFLVFLVFIVYGSQAEQIEHPYFWKVEKAGKISYLLGTFHGVIAIDELLCPQEIQQRLENSNLLLVESDYLSEQHRSFMAVIKQMKISTGGGEFQKLKKESQEFFRSRGVSEKMNFYGYSIAFRQLCRHGVEQTRGLILDDRITNVAYSNGISVWELENDIRYDLDIKEREKKKNAYDKLPEFKLELARKVLNRNIRQFSNECPPELLIKNIEDYKSGKGIEDIKKYLDNLTPEKRQADHSIMKERNLQWLERFEEVYQSHESVFLAGGLSHFVEPVNFMAMLEERGYTVAPVSCER